VIELTLGTTKLMAIFSQKEKELEDSEGYWGRSLSGVLEVLD